MSRPVIENGMEILTDMNVLYQAFKSAMGSSAWKLESDKFEDNWLQELTQLRQELIDHTYHTSKGSEFKLNERGKTRHIHGNTFRDRVIRHAFCDYILSPCIKPYLISNNGASIRGKGLSYTRKHFERDLHNFYLKYHTNQGYILFVDFSKFFDNIQHEKLKHVLYSKIPSDVYWLMDEILHYMEKDISFIQECLMDQYIDEKFDSLYYYSNVSKKQLTGEYFMKKSVNIGDQVSQDIGVFYPHQIDNYCKIVCGFKFYGRYMDDIYLIHLSKDLLKKVKEKIKEIATDLGIFINEKKTVIVKMSSTFRYLNVKYFVTESGRVVKRITGKSLTRERKRLKSYRCLFDKGLLTIKQVENAFKSWYGMNKPIMSKLQKKSMTIFYGNIFGELNGNFNES